MKAEPARQARLLDLQTLDTTIAQVEHRVRTLPDHQEFEQISAKVSELEAEEVKIRTAHDDVQREVAKAEADVQLVRDRADRNQAKLDSGTGTAKDLQALQHELESLARRQSDLEDVELEVMERAEALENELSAVTEQLEQARQQQSEVGAALEQRLAELASERDSVLAPREALVAEVGADLVALYEKIRSTVGAGAAPLVQRRCGGCQLELNQVELSRIKAADADEVLRCEECRRILVRTEQAGL